MTHLDKQLQEIGRKINQMWDLVDYQVTNGKALIVNPEPELARKVIKRGKKVNACDLKVDVLCKNFLALFNPVAIDLRWVLAILKINASLERIGDSAEGIAWISCDLGAPVEPALLEATQAVEMYDIVLEMMRDIRAAYDQKNTQVISELIKRDKALDKINRRVDKVLVAYVKANPDSMDQCLKLSNVIRKLERIGDILTNIGEEIIFYLDAKVIKHKGKVKK